MFIKKFLSYHFPKKKIEFFFKFKNLQFDGVKCSFVNHLYSNNNNNVKIILNQFIITIIIIV
jgi:hypothetical protein